MNIGPLHEGRSYRDCLLPVVDLRDGAGALGAGPAVRRNLQRDRPARRYCRHRNTQSEGHGHLYLRPPAGWAAHAPNPTLPVSAPKPLPVSLPYTQAKPMPSQSLLGQRPAADRDQARSRSGGVGAVAGQVEDAPAKPRPEGGEQVAATPGAAPGPDPSTRPGWPGWRRGDRGDGQARAREWRRRRDRSLGHRRRASPSRAATPTPRRALPRVQARPSIRPGR